MEAAIKKIDRRLTDINNFDVTSIADRSDPQIDALSSKLNTLLIVVFGADTIQYEQYRWSVTHLDTAGINVAYGTSIDEVRDGLKQGLATARAQLEAIKSEELEDQGLTTSEVLPAEQPRAVELQGLHSEILEKCSALFEAEAYPEAAERGFKIVRDRLRKITGYETGSEAFGKGGLYIHGAAAPNVEDDFNRGAKFLMMAIDMFRNEKSHTSEGNVGDPMHAYQYLMVASLALRFLDRAEIRK
jgi:uncharacterized protein (TIGR02391 family)